MSIKIEVVDYLKRYLYLDIMLKFLGKYNTLMIKQLNSTGITDEYLNKKLQEGLDAKGECYGVRKKYLDTALKIGYPVSGELQKEILDLRKSLFNGLERYFDSITSDNIKYVGDRKFWIKTNICSRNPDFIVDGHKMVIELYGDYWHKGQNPQDKIKEYKDVGYDCLVFWEHEVYNNTGSVLERVEEYCGSKI